jgi:hypothetical protein
MTNPGKVSRTLYTDTSTKPIDETLFVPTPGTHFSEICQGSIGVFVPLVGMKTSLSGAAISPTESLGVVPHSTWSSLENRRYRDVFQGNVLEQPRAYYIKRFPEPGSEKAASAFARALVDTRTPEYAGMVLQLEALAVALLIGESGGLISPIRVPWTVTWGTVRLRLRSNRLRFYSWAMQDSYRPLFERVQAGDREEFNESPIMIFSAKSLVLDASLVEHVAVLTGLIAQHAIFTKVPELREVVRRYIRTSDPSHSVGMRLVEAVTAFELVFGRLSPDSVRDTMGRLEAVLHDANAEVPDASQFASFRNAVAHGRTDDEGIGEAFGHVRLALRMFLARAIEDAAEHAAELPPPQKAFEALKQIVFGE